MTASPRSWMCLAALAAAWIACVAPDEPPEPELPSGPPPTAMARLGENGVDWNGIDWNGVDWNGVDWNGIDWNGIDAAAVDWEAIQWDSPPWSGTAWPSIAWSGPATAIDWNHVDWSDLAWNQPGWDTLDWGAIDGGVIDWSEVEVLGLWGTTGATVAVHPDARPMFMFVRARYQDQEFPLAVPAPGALRMLAQAPDRGAVLYFLQKTWQVAYGPGFYMFAGFAPGPVITEGRLGLAPSLAGFGPYAEPQVRAWTSMIGNLLNDRPLQISLRASELEALAATPFEVGQYAAVDVRAAMGRLIPPPWDPEAQPLVVLMRSRVHMLRDQLGMRGACPLEGARLRSCAGGQVWAVDLTQPGPDLGCTDVLTDGPYKGSVGGRCWVDLPGVGQVSQDAADVPMVASFVWAGVPLPPPPP